MTSNPATSDPVHALRAARQKYGLARLHMGVLLEHIRNSKGWEGHAESFTGFLEELRINHGPGYRVYLSRQGAVLVLLLCGSDKGSQSREIARAIDYLSDWKERGRP